MDQGSPPPPWVVAGLGDLGWHETGDNQGIEPFIAQAHCGQPGDPWCAIWANAKLEVSGIRGTRSPSSQSFRHDPNFVKLAGPALGALAVYWRGSPDSGLGHVGFYLGETTTQVLTLGGNESDAVRKQLEPKAKLRGYWWPKRVPLPQIAPIPVSGGCAGTVT
ncbi:MAG: TIGR02594 family protein [Pseudomonadota bacterium]